MTDKRFTNTGSCVYDQTKDKYNRCIVNCRGSTESDNICNLLNELNDENEELKDKIKRIDDLITCELVPELINLTGLTGYDGERIDFSEIIDKLGEELKE